VLLLFSFSFFSFLYHLIMKQTTINQPTTTNNNQQQPTTASMMMVMRNETTENEKTSSSFLNVFLVGCFLLCFSSSSLSTAVISLCFHVLTFVVCLYSSSSVLYWCLCDGFCLWFLSLSLSCCYYCDYWKTISDECCF